MARFIEGEDRRQRATATRHRTWSCDRCGAPGSTRRAATFATPISSPAMQCRSPAY